MSKSRSQQIAEKTIFAAFTILKEAGGELRGKDVVDKIRARVTFDWSKRDDVKAQLRLTVKKILMRYGYPPNVAIMEADRVIVQNESLVELFSEK